MQKELKPFISDFRLAVRQSPFSKDIISIILLGSAVKGEWIRGESDIDFIVVTKSRECKDNVSAFIEKTIKKLNKKYSMQLEKTTTIYKRTNPFLGFIFNIERAVFFGVPFYVISKEEFDLAHKKIRNAKVLLLASLFSLDVFLESLKETAKIIYGQNLLKEIKTNVTAFDRIKILNQQFFVMLASILILPFDAKLALKHAVKCSLYEEEFDLILLHKKTHGYFKDEKAYEKIIKSRFSLNHFEKSLYYRKQWHKITIKNYECFKFILNTIRFVVSNVLR